MFEMTYGEMFLFLWSVAATGTAWTYYNKARGRGKLLFAASLFVKQLVQDDGLRDHLREALSKDRDAQFTFNTKE